MGQKRMKRFGAYAMRVYFYSFVQDCKDQPHPLSLHRHGSDFAKAAQL
jgi:hypothetical protein